MPKNIDYDRGVLKRTHGSTGIQVYMYVDEPGVFLNAFGTPVSEVIAEEAGYDVSRLVKAKLFKERVAAATAAISEEFEHQEGQREELEERGGFKLITLGRGRYYVEDPDGNRLNPIPLDKAAITRVFDAVAPKPPEEQSAGDGKSSGVASKDAASK